MADLLKVLNMKNTDPAIPLLPPTADSASATPNKLSLLREDLERTSAQAKVMRARMDPIIDRWNHTPSIPPTAGYLSSPFGIRLSPFSRRNETDEGLLGFHAGIDITNVENTPIQATADGEVVEAGWMDRYGNGVLLGHSQQLQTLYAHMARVRVKTGQKVTRGDILGDMGRTGNATGVHLHYEVRLNGRPVNPMPYMRLQREWLSSLR
jgi:murein DD-endopeptidase MepM/ murein hydrolase activator NlpD